ncbi:MAG: TSUP family transporter [Cocleimonas sp.]
MDFLALFTIGQLVAIGLIFIWTGFVRSGIGFGGAALGLPLLLLVDDKPLIFLPIIGTHLLIFTSLTLFSHIHNVNWPVVWRVMAVIIIPKIAGLIGLFSFPSIWVVIAVFSITLFYGITWVFDYKIKSNSKLVDNILLVLGGYVSGTSLIGAPLIAAVVAKQVTRVQLRETLFILWIILVTFKMGAFVVYDVELQWRFSLVLLPLVAIGHVLGLKAHAYLLQTESTTFHRYLGVSLIVVSLAGLLKYLLE